MCTDTTDLLLFGNVPRTATPINEPGTSLAPHGGALGGSETGTGSTADGPRFLDTYSEADIRGFFRDFKLPEGQYKGHNFNEMFEDLGFKDLVFDIDVSDSFVHRVQLYTHSKTPENLLAQFAHTPTSLLSPLLHTTVDLFITNTHIGGPQAFHPTRDDVQRSGHKEVRCAAVWSARLLRQGL